MTIYRPGLILGHRGNGRCPDGDFMARLLWAALLLRAAPECVEQIQERGQARLVGPGLLGCQHPVKRRIQPGDIQRDLLVAERAHFPTTQRDGANRDPVPDQGDDQHRPPVTSRILKPRVDVR